KLAVHPATRLTGGERRASHRDFSYQDAVIWRLKEKPAPIAAPLRETAAAAGDLPAPSGPGERLDKHLGGGPIAAFVSDPFPIRREGRLGLEHGRAQKRFEAARFGAIGVAPIDGQT